MTYPAVFEEHATVKALAEGKSIARFGDGELKIILGRDCVSQRTTPEIQKELLHILRSHSDICLTGIMNLNGPTAKPHWEKYRESKYTRLLDPAKTYYSSFITRPDSVPWINTQEYWDKIVKLWQGKNVLLVTGGRSSALRPENMPEALSIKTLDAPQENAYGEIDSIEKSIIGITKSEKIDIVIMCLGATATCLAWRLAHNHIHALDLGHLAMFYRRFLKGESINGNKR